MTIVVNNLNKFYGKWQVLKDISFSVNRGDILGFLGPNGAGKTTTMKIITNLVKPTSGSVLVNGLDTLKYPDKAAQYIGYLPENNPLYTDFYVIEAIEFIYKLRKKNIQLSTIKDILEKTGLLSVKNKKIKTLSKGYKQRLGIAQAIIHNPDILILDEPSSGLDPIQIIEIRKLIKEIAKNKAVLISTHIMQEVEAICNKIMIIKKGKIIAKEILSKQENNAINIIKIEFNRYIDTHQLALFLNFESEKNIKKIDDKTFIIQSQNDVREYLMKFAIENNLTILHLSPEKKSIEEIFYKL